MSDTLSLVSALRRPKLLIRAARFGLSEYRRERDLRRLIRRPTSPEAAIRYLLDEEHKLEQTRTEGRAYYCVTQHIEVLIALLAEVRLVQQKS